MITKDTREHHCPECYVEFIFLKNGSYAMSTKIVFLKYLGVDLGGDYLNIH